MRFVCTAYTLTGNEQPVYIFALMFRIEKNISLTVNEQQYHGLLKVVAEKWCYINESGHYFKIFYTQQTNRIGILGDRTHEVPLKRFTEQLKSIISSFSI